MGGQEWTVRDVAGLLRSQKRAGRKCCLLIGAGVSRSAGIGTGPDFVQLIRKDYGDAYERARAKAADGAEPDYGACMGELTEGERAQLVHEQVDKARINWAHIGIARLEMDGAEYVDRILTTNFDPLASRACALFNRFPAVYDLAALRNVEGSNRARFIPAFVSGSAIYHLHGQHTGFLLLNTRELLEEQAERIEPALKEAIAGRTVIVCGYSGENDPLVDRLSRQDVYPHGLIWVCHDDRDPCRHVMENVVRRVDDCRIVRNMPADRFFTELANALDLPQPPFLIQPFQHMLTALDHIRPYSDLSETGFDLLEQARALLTEAEGRHGKKAAPQSEIAELMAQEKYAEILHIYEAVASELDEGARDLVAWAAVMEGLALANQAVLRAGEEAEALFSQAIEKYAAALAINPDKHEALNNWGIALAYQARLKQGGEAEALLGQAVEKYAAAVAINQDKHTLNNWGVALADQARLKQGGEAEALLGQAIEKYAAAVAIKPKFSEALYNWGNALANRGRLKQGEEAEALLGQAVEKYAAALAIKPDYHEALSNWGNALADQARLKQRDEAKALLGEATEKYAAALAIKPDNHEALGNWGAALADQARLDQGEEAEALRGQAIEKYAAALAIKPNFHAPLYNWGNVLADQARLKQGDEAEALFGQAFEKYAAAVAIKPDYYEALSNWGTGLLFRAHKLHGDEQEASVEEAECKFLAARSYRPNAAAYNLACVAGFRKNAAKAAEWLRVAKAEGDLPDCAHIAADADLDAVREDPAFVQAMGDVGC